MEGFGDKLRRLRADTPQKTVAEALGIPQTTLSSLEKQDGIPRGDVLKRLAEFFGVPVDYFYDAEIRSSERALTWLNELKHDAKARDTIATRSSVPLDAKTSKKLAEKIREKYRAENSDNPKHTRNS